MSLFGPLHLAILAAIASIAAAAVWLRRRDLIPDREMRLGLGCALAFNELVWWVYRYTSEGVHVSNLPLQLCDAAVWFSVLACLTEIPVIVEFAYFAGLAGAGMALLTPNLISPWPSYPAVYFFLAHGGIVISMIALVAGNRRRLPPGAVFRAFGLLLSYAALVGFIDRAFTVNFMFLCNKPEAASALDAMGPWPAYLLAAASAGFAMFWLLWLPVRPRLVETANGSGRRVTQT